jgi:polyisoprenyl-phosphate glycosyltransferase
MRASVEARIDALQGPILVLGASGFIGANLFRMLLRKRSDVFGTSSSTSAWRLEALPADRIITGDLLVEFNLAKTLDAVAPRTVFGCVAYGAYSFETDYSLIYKTNVSFTARLLEELRVRGAYRYIHAGSSSEYGDHASAPREDSALTPNSHYSVSKAAASGLIYYAGKRLGFGCANLRLYSVYGPYEDSSRLIPTVVACGVAGGYPDFVDPDISRDFIYVDDACEAFVDAALGLRQELYGESFNIGSGRKTTIADVAELAGEIFHLPGRPQFTMRKRDWDVSRWYADPSKARQQLGWEVRTPLRSGLEKTATWYQALQDRGRYLQSSKKFGVDEKYSVSAVVACYRDAQAIPIMYQRLKAAFEELNVAFELIFVNDNSPDDTEEVIRAISARDRRVIGVTHSRNFGSQAAFRSGMEIATKNACVLLDGDLQDPPELIKEFVRKWREGYEVVYGRRVKREAPWYMQVAYKAFYRIFDRFSYISIPRDAGDFSLMDRRVINSVLSFPERDLFVRGVRAFAGFSQTGVDYVRPERMFGVTTNSLFKNIGWAKKGVLSFSHAPLNMLTSAGVVLFVLSCVLALAQVVARLAFPAAAPRGFTSLVLVVIFFGSLNMLGLSLIGEYIAKIFEEVKRRPHYIRRHIIRDGEVRLATEESLSHFA